MKKLCEDNETQYAIGVETNEGITMVKLLGFLARTPVLWGLFLLFIIMGVGFYFVEQAVGGPLLDMQMNAEDALARLGAMSNEQKHMHLLATLTLDTFYPLAYGGLLAGIIWRLGGSLRRFLVIPALLSVLADFAENTVQAFALAGSGAGSGNILAAKNILTPLKYMSISLAAIIALGLLFFALLKRIRRKKN